MQIEYRSLAELTPYANNAKQHPPAQVANLAESIRRFGFRNPVLVDGSGVIVAGHGRCMAAKEAGMKEVPVLVCDDMSEEDIRAYRILDNKLNESPWDYEKLSLELPGLDLSGFSLKLHADLNPIDPAQFPDMPLPDVELGKVKQGDKWKLGTHILVCGDSTKSEDMAKLMGVDKAHLLLIDPPYNVSYEGGAGSILNDNMPGAEFRRFLISAFRTCAAVTVPGCAFFIWFGVNASYEFYGACKDAGLVIHQQLVWIKQSAVLSRQDFNWQTEACLAGELPPNVDECCLYGWTEGKAHSWFKDDKQSNVLTFDRPTKSEEHPTMKPLAMFGYQISCVTEHDDIVLDPFGGSGTTLIACEKLGRKCRMMELDPHYCDVIIRRWEDLTGDKAVLCE